jgi:hypothetical protein
MRLKEIIAGAAVAGALAAGAIGAGIGTASAEGPMPPPLPPAGPDAASPPAWAPSQPAPPVWAAGNKQVWDAGWQHWGVWMNGVFIPTF